MKKVNFLWILLIGFQYLSAQEIATNIVEQKRNSKNEIYHHLGKAPRDGGFFLKGFWVWDNTVIKGEDGKYHLFSSSYPDTIPFHPGWMVSSEIVHAIADKPEGPFRYVDKALPNRGAQFWDGHSTFNPQIKKYKGKYYMFYERC